MQAIQYRAYGGYQENRLGEFLELMKLYQGRAF